MNDEAEFGLTDPNWRRSAKADKVRLTEDIITSERNVYLAIEKLIPYTQQKYGRNPKLNDIILFILILGGE